MSKYSGYPAICFVSIIYVNLCINKVNVSGFNDIIRNELYECVKILRQCLVSILFTTLHPNFFLQVNVFALHLVLISRITVFNLTTKG